MEAIECRFEFIKVLSYLISLDSLNCIWAPVFNVPVEMFVFAPVLC